MNRHELLENGTVVETHATCLAVEVDGVEVYVGTRIEPSGCECCGDTCRLTVSYNRSTEYRIEHHGEPDPLNIL